MVSSQTRSDNIVSTTSFEDIGYSAFEISLAIKNATLNDLMLAKKHVL